jgi:hypothetical protein
MSSKSGHSFQIARIDVLATPTRSRRTRICKSLSSLPSITTTTRGEKRTLQIEEIPGFAVELY